MLNENEVKYLIIGGYAVNVHGYPRYTKDIDFWIWLDNENIDRRIQTLGDFGFASLNLDPSQFQDPDGILQLGYEPHRINILMGVNGVEFQECYQRKKVSVFDGTHVNFLSVNDLIEVKKIAGRAKDLADAEELQILIDQGKIKDSDQ